MVCSIVSDRSWSGTNWNQSLTLLMTIIIANSKVELHTLALVYYTSSFIQHISMILVM